jgi:hypothetical protein
LETEESGGQLGERQVQAAPRRLLEHPPRERRSGLGVPRPDRPHHDVELRSERGDESAVGGQPLM